jgi:hypothetical protein
MVVNLPFGTMYAFRVFLKSMEALLGATRAEMRIRHLGYRLCSRRFLQRRQEASRLPVWRLDDLR